MPSQRRAAGADELMLESRAGRLRQARHQPGQIVPRGETVADEQHLQRGVVTMTLSHVILELCGRRVG